MKKLLLILLIVFFAGCAKETIKTTYQIINNIPQQSITCIASCYIGDDIVKKDHLPLIFYGDKSEKIEAPYFTNVINVSSVLYDSGIRMYIITNQVIERGKNNIITINL